jgi:CHAT domain-containing protein
VPSKSVAVFADPVFEQDDPRIQVTRQNPNKPAVGNRSSVHLAWRDVIDVGDAAKLQRLPASSREAQEIINLVPPGSSLKAVGFKANRETVTSKQLSLYRAVHFATHGILDEVNPERSGVVLSLYDEQGRFHEEGYLRLKDIYDLNLPIDLVVLSACRTGLGKAVKGEGVIGLARGFMYAGTRRVMASLWKVHDDATAELMKRFYQKMLKEGMTPAAALRAAQSSMASDSQWRHPYYWAGFILQGEPK